MPPSLTTSLAHPTLDILKRLAPDRAVQLIEDHSANLVELVSTGHLDLALALSDSTVALERGQVIYQGASKALRDDLDLRRKVLWL